MATKTAATPAVIGYEAGSRAALDVHGLDPQQDVHWNLSPAQLYEKALARGEGR